MDRYLVIIARNRPDLLGRLATIYGQKGEVEIHFDRRHGQSWSGQEHAPERRTAPHGDADLQRRGFLVIRRPATAAAPH